MTDPNSGVGWYEVIHPSTATTHIAYVYEDGSVYFPEGLQSLDRHEFEFAAARGNAHRLVRADAQSGDASPATCGCDLTGMYPPAVHIVDGHDDPQSGDPEPCLCDGGAYGPQDHPFLTHPECRVHARPDSGDLT